MSELEKVSLARILCDNSDIETMQPDAFRLVSTRYQSVAAREWTTLGISQCQPESGSHCTYLTFQQPDVPMQQQFDTETEYQQMEHRTLDNTERK